MSTVQIKNYAIQEKILKVSFLSAGETHTKIRLSVNGLQVDAEISNHDYEQLNATSFFSEGESETYEANPFFIN
jgi:hypothetical protein